MRKLFIWMFTRRPIDDVWELSNKVIVQLLTLASPFLAAALLWRWSNGFAMAVLMTGLCVVGFIFTTFYRWNFLPAQAGTQTEARRVRRKARTEFWRREIEIAAREPGKRGDLARSILERQRASAPSENDEPRS